MTLNTLSGQDSLAVAPDVQKRTRVLPVQPSLDASQWQVFVLSGGEQVDQRPAEFFRARFDRPHARKTSPAEPASLVQQAQQNKAGARESASLAMDTPWTELLADAAHDIRSPLAVAQQILSALSERAKQSTWEPRDAELIQTARLRLLQASRWAENVLLESNLGRGEPVNIRSRFYPHQWRASMEPLLKSLASQRRVQIVWQGWECSLPRLYLDTNQLSRAVLNLVSNAIHAAPTGSQIFLNVRWQYDSSRRLTIAILDEGPGLSIDLMRQVNAAELWPEPKNAAAQVGRGLRTAKMLVRSVGGSIHVQAGRNGGTAFHLILPIDDCQSMVRDWLLRNQQAVAAAGQAQAERRIDMVAIRSSDGDGHFIDSQLQQAAEATDLIYRVANDRWLWLCLSAPGEIMGQSITNCLTQLGRRRLTRMRSQQVFQLSPIVLDDLHRVSTPRYLLPDVSRILAEKMEALIGDRIPPLDDLTANSNPSIALRPIGGIQRVIRQDQAHAHQPLSTPRAATVRAATVRANDRPRAAELADAEPATAERRLSNSLSEISHQWHMAQQLLDHVRSQHVVFES